VPSETVWPLDEHTRAKHELLRRYLGAWFPILTYGGFHRRVLFLDGFAGPGVYADGEPGSPIIALNTLVSHRVFGELGRTEFVFMFVESDHDRCVSLDDELQAFWDRNGGQPKNVRVHVIESTFADLAGELLDHMREQKKQLAPTFAFVDPFGWKGVPLALIADLLSYDRCEVLFNFMYDSVNRWVTDERPGIARHFADLFGTGEDEHRRAAGLAGDERKRFLRDLYAHQLRAVGGFPYVRAFELMDIDRGRTAYYLMYGTRHHRGLEVMKDAMWALDPIGGVRFSGFAGDEAMLFEPEPDFGPLEDAIRREFSGREVSVVEIERFVIEHTDYKTTHYKKNVLKELEANDLIECLSDRKRRGTYPPGTVLRFRSAAE